MKDLIELKENLEGERSVCIIMAYLKTHKGVAVTSEEAMLQKYYDGKIDALDKAIKMIDEKLLKYKGGESE